MTLLLFYAGLCRIVDMSFRERLPHRKPSFRERQASRKLGSTACYKRTGAFGCKSVTVAPLQPITRSATARPSSVSSSPGLP